GERHQGQEADQDLVAPLDDPPGLHRADDRRPQRQAARSRLHHHPDGRPQARRVRAHAHLQGPPGRQEGREEVRMATMETRSIVRGVRLSADKGRLVADFVRGKKVDQAINILNSTQKRAAGIIKKALESAIANAEHNDGADIDELKVKSIYVEQGATLKRFSARAKGRGNRISKPTAHIYITVGNSRHSPWEKSSPPPGSACRSRATGLRVGTRT